MDALLPPQRRKALRLIAVLLAVWFAVTFGVAWFARDLNFLVLGSPFSFWVAAQGGLIVYVAITWVYAHAMRRLEQQQEAAEPPAQPAPGGRRPDVV